MPMSNMNPILVLQRRLDVAIGEIQELRTQVDDLQAQLTGRTEMLEQRLRLITERQDDSERLARMNLSQMICNHPELQTVDDVTEQDMKTPTTRDTFSEPRPPHLVAQVASDSAVEDMPGSYHQSADEEDLILWSWPLITRVFAIWCLARILDDNIIQLSLLAFLTLILCCSGQLSPQEFCANIMSLSIVDEHVRSVFHRSCTVLKSVHTAARTMNLESKKEYVDHECTSKGGIVAEESHVDDKVSTEEIGAEHVPVLLC